MVKCVYWIYCMYRIACIGLFQMYCMQCIVLYLLQYCIGTCNDWVSVSWSGYPRASNPSYAVLEMPSWPHTYQAWAAQQGTTFSL